MKGLFLALILALSATSGLAGAAIAGADAPGDAAGFWAWLVANSPAEEANCCDGTDQPCPRVSCPPLPTPDPTALAGTSRPNRR